MSIAIAKPFNIIAYSLSPPTLYIGIPATITPVPNVAQATYAVTSGTLPPGLSLNATTGVISGTPTLLMKNNVVTITATFVDTTTYALELPFSILNIPTEAQDSNALSQNGLLELGTYHTNIFISDVNYQISQANQLGKFRIYATVPAICNYNTILNYFSQLNYSLQLVNWRAGYFQPGQYNSPWEGEFYGGYGSYPTSWGLDNPFAQPRPGYPQTSFSNNRISISWTPYPIGRFAPYFY